MRPNPYRVHGMMQSYFTRKMTGYLDYKGIPWVLRRFPGASPEAMASGFPGGVPAVETPAGEFMWDSTAMIHHLELRFPEPAVLPADPVQRFVCYLVEDAADEWLYRAAVGTRWYFAENAAVGGFELARDIAVKMPVSCDQAHAAVGAHVLSSCPPLGVTADTIQLWVDDVLRPWMRVLGAHLARRPYLFGERPSLADFALFGGNAAHFTNDPLCRRWVEEDGPAVVQHTHRLLEPEEQAFGAWDDPATVPDTLTAVLAGLGKRCRGSAARASTAWPTSSSRTARGWPCARRTSCAPRARPCSPATSRAAAGGSTPSSSGRASCRSSRTTSRTRARSRTSARRRVRR